MPPKKRGRKSTKATELEGPAIKKDKPSQAAEIKGEEASGEGTSAQTLNVPAKNEENVDEGSRTFCSYVGERKLDLFPLLLSLSLPDPVHNLVSYRGCVYARFGGKMGGVWKLHIPGGNQQLGQVDEDGHPKPEIIISGLNVPDGHGLCIDTKRDLIVFLDERTIFTYDLNGKLIKKKVVPGVNRGHTVDLFLKYLF